MSPSPSPSAPPTPGTSIPNPAPGKDPPPSTTTTSDPAPPQSQSQLQAQAQSNIFARPIGKEPTRPPFSTPFFTLIHDDSTESTIHPSRVHYIFSDDDGSEELSAACLRALEGSGPAGAGSGDSSLSRRQMMGESQESSSSGATFREREIQRGKEREERVLILDVNATGDGIVKAESLSANWQVLSTEIAKAPTWDAPDSKAEEEDADAQSKGMMLRIEGTGILAGDGPAVSDEVGSGVMTEEQMHGLMEGFEGKMRVLRRVVESAGLRGALDAGLGKERLLEEERIEAEEQEREEREAKVEAQEKED